MLRKEKKKKEKEHNKNKQVTYINKFEIQTFMKDFRPFFF